MAILTAPLLVAFGLVFGPAAAHGAAPVAHPGVATLYGEESSIALHLVGTDPDPGTQLRFTIVLPQLFGPYRGALGSEVAGDGTVDPGVTTCASTASGSRCTATITYSTPEPWMLPDSFRFMVSDASSSQTATFSIEHSDGTPLLVEPETVSLDPVPDRAVVTARAISLVPDSTVTFELTGQPEQATAALLGAPVCVQQDAEVRCSQAIEVFPELGATGTDFVTFVASDGTRQASSSIQLLYGNQPPEIAELSYLGVVEPDTMTTLRLDALDRDDQNLTATLTDLSVGTVAGPTLTCGVAGIGSHCFVDLEFTPPAEYTGPVTANLTISDGAATARALLSWDVGPPSSALPVIENQTVTVTDNGGEFTVVATDPDNPIVDWRFNSFGVGPGENPPSDMLTEGERSVILVDTTCTATAPFACTATLRYQPLGLAQDGLYVSVTDSVTAPAGEGEPEPPFRGDTAFVTIEVATEPNTGPVTQDVAAVGYTDELGVTVVLRATDADGDPLTFSVAPPPPPFFPPVWGPFHGTYGPEVDASGEIGPAFVDCIASPAGSECTATITYIGDGSGLDDTFTFGVSDGTETAGGTVTITWANRSPIPGGVNESIPVAPTITTLTVWASDPDGPALTFTIEQPLTHGFMQLVGDPVCTTHEGGVVVCGQELTIEPEAGYHGADHAILLVSDGERTAPLHIELYVGDRPPELVTPPTGIFRHQPSYPMTATFADLDDTEFTVEFTGVSSGTITDVNTVCQPTGFGGSECQVAWVYTPASGAFAEITAEGTATDGTLTSPFGFTWLVGNQPPYGSSDVVFAADGTATLAAADVEGDPITFRIVRQPSRGTIELVGAPTCEPWVPASCYQAVQYTHTAVPTGLDQFEFVVNDGFDDSAVTTVTFWPPPLEPPAAKDVVLRSAAPAATLIPLEATSPRGEPLTFEIVTPPRHGTVELIGPPTCAPSGESCTATALLTPEPGFEGFTSFEYRAADHLVASQKAVVVLGDGRPTVEAPRGVTIDNEAAPWIPIWIGDSDTPQYVHTLGITIVEPPSHGTYDVHSYCDSLGRETELLAQECSVYVDYTPYDHTVPDRLVFTVTDGTTVVGPITIEINPPMTVLVTPSTASAEENHPITLTAEVTGGSPNGHVIAWETDSDGQYDDGVGESVTFTPPNGPADFYASARAIDHVGSAASGAARIEVFDVAPTAELIVPDVAVLGSTFTVSLGAAADVAHDLESSWYTLSCGGQWTEQVTSPPTLQCQALAPGPMQVSATVGNDDGSRSYSVYVSVEPAPVTDQFDRPNGPLGGGWLGRVNSFSIVEQTARLTVGTAGFLWRPGVLPANQWGRVQLTTVLGQGTQTGLVLRAQPGSSTVPAAGVLVWNTPGYGLRVGTFWANAARSRLVATVGVNLVPGDEFQAALDGSIVRIYRGTSLIAVVDLLSKPVAAGEPPGLSTGMPGAAGLYVLGRGGGFDNFGAGG